VPNGRAAQVSALPWLLAGVVLSLSFGYTEMQGSDLWWHIAAGREILQNGSLWLSDSWSYSAAGASWVNHEWLADLIYYGWVTTLDLESLVYWKWLVVILTYSILQLSLTRDGVQPGAAFICVAIAMAIAAPFIDIRPHLYTLLGFSTLIYLLLNRDTATWKLALLFVVWVNLHGGFIFGLMALGIFVFPRRDLSVKALVKPARIMLVCTLACLINPDGINSFLLPLTYALDFSSPYRNLGEWLSPFQRGGIQAPLFFWALGAAPVIALAYALPVVRRQTGVPWQGLALCTLTVLMSLTSRRFIPLFAISFAVMSAPLLGLLFHKAKADKVNLALALVALGYASFRMLPYPLSAGPAYHYLTAEYTYPIDTLSYVEVNGIQGKVFAYYNWGGYVHWRTDGKLKVFIDGRANTVYDDKTYNQYVAVMGGRRGWQASVESTGAEYFLWPYYRGKGLEKLQVMLRSGRWKAIYQDSVSYLLARTSVASPVEGTPSAATPYRMLAAAQLSAFRGDEEAAAAQSERVLEEIPYQKNACNLAARSHRQLGDAARAAEIVRNCRAYFPSPQLR